MWGSGPQKTIVILFKKQFPTGINTKPEAAAQLVPEGLVGGAPRENVPLGTVHVWGRRSR